MVTARKNIICIKPVLRSQQEIFYLIYNCHNNRQLVIIHLPMYVLFVFKYGQNIIIISCALYETDLMFIFVTYLHYIDIY